EEARIARMISRIEVSRPPGVFMRRMTRRVSAGLSAASSCVTYSAVAGPIAPSISSTATRPAAAADDDTASVQNNTAHNAAMAYRPLDLCAGARTIGALLARPPYYRHPACPPNTAHYR